MKLYAHTKKQTVGIFLCWITTMAFFFVACDKPEPKQSAPPTKISPTPTSNPEETANVFVGSKSCRECHEQFYQLWESSNHGKAMQPYSVELAASLTEMTKPLEISKSLYQAYVAKGEGWVSEVTGERTIKYPITQVMGGKNIYYFLTPMERGRLQVLPVAYKIDPGEWYDTADSMLRHFDEVQDSVLEWRDSMLTFNTSCFGCHVSQMSNDYDLKTDSYSTEWREPGINCEACHGPGAEHARVCREAASQGVAPTEMKLLVWSKLRPDQRTDACATCHAKTRILTPEFEPGDRYFDHYGLACLEDRDFYPDGRDLGENYTLTGWLMGDCLAESDLDCVHCHTSSGRYRFAAPEVANNACLPCHKERVANAPAHTRHPAKSKGNQCISCHSPMTSFAHMHRSDHSFRPPMPALSIRFGSPNACVICHEKKDDIWALGLVEEWHGESKFVAREMERAELIAAGRKGDVKDVPRIMEFIAKPDANEVFVTSLVRMLPQPLTEAQSATLREVESRSTSPLVRSAIISQLSPSLGNLPTLLKATSDDFLVVRVEAAQMLRLVPPEYIPEKDRAALKKAAAESEKMLTGRLDHWSSHLNIGNMQMDEEKYKEAAASFDLAHKMRPDIIQPLVNSAMAYARLADLDAAEKRLRTALTIGGENSAAVHLNLGLLLIEKKRQVEGEFELKQALKADPNFAQAAFNLGLLQVDTHPQEAIVLLTQAVKGAPYEPYYYYTLAFHQFKNKQTAAAEKTLRNALAKNVFSEEIYMLLGEILLKTNRLKEAEAIRQEAIQRFGLRK